MLIDDTYQTIKDTSTGLYKEKGSKFIAIAIPVCSEDAIKEIVENARREYHDARHHCYAYIVGAKADKWRINDDGEPSGTAGKPIYGQLLSFKLTNTLVIVVRYFGGTKLGVSGLINAYRAATHDALQNATVITKTVDDIYWISFGYLAMNDVMRAIKEFNVDISEQQFGNSCNIKVVIRKSLSTEFLSRVEKIESVNAEYLSTV